MNKVGPGSAQLLDQVASREKETSMIADLKSLFKVGIVNSNLFTAFTGFWLALHFSNASIFDYWGILILTIIGSAFVIIGACILNNYYDRDIDPIMSRTTKRPTVTGSISLKNVLIMGLSLSAAGFVLLLFTTFEAALYAFAGWFTYVVLYTMWTKRRYTLNTAVGSISGAMPPLIGWAAVDPNLHIVAIVLFIILFIWQTPHFLALAMKKCEEYKAASIPMLPVVHGFEFTKRQMIVYTVCLLPLPFYLASLGTTFLIIASILNIGWVIIGISGLFTKNDLKWANIMFIYSLNYLTILCLVMVLVTVNTPI